MREIRNGNLYIDGTSANELARIYGTPLMVMSETDIASKCRQIKDEFINRYENVRAAYAGKAFLTLAICKIMEREGMCLDVVSGGELYTAIKAEFDPNKIEFNGNNKSIAELEMAIEYGVSRIIVDGTDEISLIESICQRLGKTTKILIRFSPGVDSHTHEYITTGNIDSKFGVPLSDGIIEEVIKAALNSSYIELLGFHFHVGSQLHDNQSHIMATKILLELIEGVMEEFSFIPTEINLGGGFGIRYGDEDLVKPYSYFLDPVMELISEFFETKGATRPAVVIEPGRSIVGEAGTTLYTIGTIKNIPGVRKYVSVNGGMTDNIRPALYGSTYEYHIDSNSEKIEKVTICGKCCESGDILLRDIEVKQPNRGDLFAIYATGAYCYSMSSNYNKIPLPGVVLTSNGNHRQIVKGQTFEELIERELF
ncbi:MAG: diaminopimelate decarboxylase [Anaerovoracaceae bacterium]